MNSVFSSRTSFPADSINQPVGNLYDCSFSVDAHPVNLFQSNLVTENDMKTLVYESLSTAILDSGVTATVAGRVWMECYLDSLTEKEKSRVGYAESNTSFCFSAGEIVSSIGKVTIPAIIGSKSVTVEVDLVDKDIPLLLSDESLKKANTSINFKDCTVKMFGKKLSCIFTSAGHIAVPLHKNLNVLHAVETRSAKVNINFQYIDGSDKYEIATKLHSVFSHCPASKLIKVIDAAGMRDDVELVDEIHTVSNSCMFCREYKKFSSSVSRENSATAFNETVSVKLTSFKGRWIIYLIDHVSRFSVASQLQSNNPEEIFRKITENWISIFGLPNLFVIGYTDALDSFQLQSLLKSTTEVIVTDKGSWSNALCKRSTENLEEIMKRNISRQCELQAVLCWSVHLMNSVTNIHGFSPYEIVMGYTPGSLHQPYNLNTVAAARESLLCAETNRRMKRSLRKISPSTHIKYVPGDSVYFRQSSKSWKGPGKVIAHGDEFVLLKKGAKHFRLHPCRVMLEKQGHIKSSKHFLKSLKTSLRSCDSSFSNIGSHCPNEYTYSVNREPVSLYNSRELSWRKQLKGLAAAQQSDKYVFEKHKFRST